ncbi:hypothetical protein PG997_008846 [Apiospora hydei]|uniref:Uncharacterized protein n=1 Tax=Apiospora hydei TaxID=1337664 RepID=A0ABR1WBY8_9PEZI
MASVNEEVHYTVGEFKDGAELIPDGIVVYRPEFASWRCPEAEQMKILFCFAPEQVIKLFLGRHWKGLLVGAGRPFFGIVTGIQLREYGSQARMLLAV